MNKRILAAGLGALALATSSVPALAQSNSAIDNDRGANMMADLLIVRPIGIVGTVLGAAGFIVSLPFTLPTGSTGEAARAMVGNPFEYTFNRPLGDFDNCGRDRHPCGSNGGN